MKSSSKTYAQLELLTSPEPLLYPPSDKAPAAEPSRSLPQQIAALLKQAASIGMEFFVGSTNPVIRQKRDRTGQTYFLVHDPLKGQFHRFYDEQALRVWLDTRYNR